MKRAAIVLVFWLCALPASGADGLARGKFVSECIGAAAQVYRLPPGVIAILLNVENGRLGQASPNKNGSFDLGPMQVNDGWLDKLAAHWRATREEALRAVRDEICPNIEAGAWILRQALDEAKGVLWEGVALYHSHSAPHKARYLRAVYEEALRLGKEAGAWSAGEAR